MTQQGELRLSTGSVSVYRNISNGTLSVKHKGLVVGHCDHIEMEDVSLHVNKAGAKRILNGGNKEVVAWATGFPTVIEGFLPYKGRNLPPLITRYTFECLGWDKGIYFNPKKGVNWLDEDGYVIEKLGYIEVRANGRMNGAEV